MAYCTYCGNQNRRGAGFCRYCGQPMDIIEDVSEAGEASAEVIGVSIQAATAVNEPVLPVEDLPVQPEQPGENLAEAAGKSSSAIATESDEMPVAAAGVVIENSESEAIVPEQEGAPPPPDETFLIKLVNSSQTEVEKATDQDAAPATVPVSDEFEGISTVEGETPQLAPVLIDDVTQVEGDAPSLTGLTALEVLESGAVLLERYHIVAELARSDDRVEYEAEDWQRCWACLATQSDPEAKFCEMCGAQLQEKPHVRLIASPLSITSEQERGKDDFVEGDAFFQVVVSQATEQAGAEAAPRLRFASGFQLHPGMVRGNNEDSLLVLELNVLSEVKDFAGLCCYAVADGIGGYEAGEVASGAAVRVLSAQIMSEIFSPIMSGETLDREAVKLCLQNAILKANQEILDLRQQQPEHSDMGCTLTLALVLGSEAVVANVGDSRTYQMRQGKLKPISQDHSIVARLVEQGMIKPQEIYTHEQRNVIYRTVGDRADLQVDLFEVDLESGDRLLLCSDGLWEMVHDPNLEDVLLESYDAQQACNRLVEMANQAGGQDNISVIVINVQS